MNDKKDDITDEERKLFRDAVNAIKSFRPKPIKKAPMESDPPSDRFYAPSDIPNDIAANDVMHFAKSGLQFRLLQKLKRGKIIPQASLDLHRHTIAMAEEALDQFIRHALSCNHRCVHIIHGKGTKTKDNQARLKNWLNIWLRQHRYVLAFHSAQPKDGGTGAVYVLLKRSSA